MEVLAVIAVLVIMLLVTAHRVQKRRGGTASIEELQKLEDQRMRRYSGPGLSDLKEPRAPGRRERRDADHGG